MKKLNLSILFSLLFLIIFPMFAFDYLYSQTRIEGEIILGAIGMDNSGWFYEWVANSEIRWWSDHCITDQYFSGETEIIYRPDEEEGAALSSPDSPGEIDIAYGQYLFTFHSNSLGIHEDFYIDLRDANWSMEQPPYPFPVDLRIRWNNDKGFKKF